MHCLQSPRNPSCRYLLTPPYAPFGFFFCHFPFAVPGLNMMLRQFSLVSMNNTSILVSSDQLGLPICTPVSL